MKASPSFNVFLKTEKEGLVHIYKISCSHSSQSHPTNWNKGSALSSNTITLKKTETHQRFKMQAALCIAPVILPFQPSKNFSTPAMSAFPKLTGSISSRVSSIKATAAAPNEPSVVDYSSASSVFPAEACETIGGEACVAEMYPEVKLKPEARNDIAKTASELTEREYLEYTSPKTVLPGEACDALGGEFCERPYQRGVY